MSSEQKRTPSERRDAILEVLCVRRKMTISELVTEFDVSRRTIINDIIELTRSYPIETYRGNGGGVEVAKGYYLGRKYLKPAQREALIDAIANSSGETRTGLESILREFSL